MVYWGLTPLQVDVGDASPIKQHPYRDDCIDRVGHANFVSRIDLLKGFYQTELTVPQRLERFLPLSP